MSDPTNYSVGWICTRPVEFAAAQLALDQVYDPAPFIPARDGNNYRLGKIDAHNVVIALLPDAEGGPAAAAIGASYMLNSFPNLRIQLMVGIGGGAPSQKNDIRLGDVVVSAVRDGNTGVLQYNFGKHVQDKEFQVTSMLNPPPTILRTAVANISAAHTIHPNGIDHAIHTILSRNPRLRPEFQQPHPTTDRLFKSHVEYQPGRQFANSDLVARRPRGPHEDSPAVYYGTIASGRFVMRNARTRDKLIQQKNVLCFETEAAGLMNDVHGLVIRGISHYSDSHQTDAWQGYAAMAAACYAKDLVKTIAPTTLEVQRNSRERPKAAVENSRRRRWFWR